MLIRPRSLPESRLPLCSRNIDKMYCTNWEVVKLSCADTTGNNIYGFLLMVSHLAQVLLIMVSYGHIVRACRSSKAGRRKFFQTCLPHLTTLSVFTLSLVFEFMFARYGGGEGLRTLSNLMACFPSMTCIDTWCFPQNCLIVFGSVFQRTEEDAHAFLDKELKKLWSVLFLHYPQCSESQREEEEEVVDGKKKEQRRRAIEGVGDIVQFCLVESNQEDLADALWSSKYCFEER
ncbi:hypothetical protein CRUP_026938 [Coryphaenoides rupestris]|nr:hypothetical protein CRUP_026938 [Coryphaenoides rupestris]